jgi:hypothetical protein
VPPQHSRPKAAFQPRQDQLNPRGEPVAANPEQARGEVQAPELGPQLAPQEGLPAFRQMPPI